MTTKELSDKIAALAEETASLAFNGASEGVELSQICQAHLELRRAVASMRAAEALTRKSERAA